MTATQTIHALVASALILAIAATSFSIIARLATVVS
jgi:hypothetical protein